MKFDIDEIIGILSAVGIAALLIARYFGII